MGGAYGADTAIYYQIDNYSLAKPGYFSYTHYMDKICETTINILGFFDKEENIWSAVALELDLWGYGDTKDESLKEIIEAIQAQIGFSEFKNNPDLLLHPAPAMYFHMYAQAQNEALQAGVYHNAIERDTFAAGIPFPTDSNSRYAVA